MNEPIANSPPKDSWFNAFYKANSAWLNHLFYGVIITVIAAIFHMKADDLGGLLQQMDHKQDATAEVVAHTDARQKEIASVTLGEKEAAKVESVAAPAAETKAAEIKAAK